MYFNDLSCLQEFYFATFCNFFLFYTQLFTATFINFDFGTDPAGIKLYLDQRLELNSDLKAIVEMTRSNISPELYAKLLNCQATSCSVERSFSMLGKLLAKDRHFSPKNVWKYLVLYVNKSLE